jgi:hypothetical protein
MGKPTLSERFWAKVSIANDDDCWGWRNATNRKGYGILILDGKSKLAHRVAWELCFGEIPHGQMVLHKCHNRDCCNPSHLAIGDKPDTSLHPSPEERFWAKVAKGGTEECWEWQGSRNEHGYGSFGVRNRCTKGAHRVSWEIAHGDIPEGVEVCHRCDNPPCCNPGHLFLGTHADNMGDCKAKGRTARHVGDALAHCPERRARGERQGLAKLTWEDARAIRSRFAIGGVTKKALAIEYGVNPSTLADVISEKTWRTTSS